MTDNKKQNRPMSLTVTEGLTVQIIPNNQHEFLMSSKEVASGYGTSEYAVRQSKVYNAAELEEGKHFVSAVRISHSDPANKIYWTKRGIVRLGFFIKSKNAKLFRDWAEDLILDKLNQQATLFELPVVTTKPKGNYNRLTPVRMIDIMHDVMKIEDTDLRVRIANKLKGGNNG